MLDSSVFELASQNGKAHIFTTTIIPQIQKNARENGYVFRGFFKFCPKIAKRGNALAFFVKICYNGKNPNEGNKGKWKLAL